MQKFSDTRMMNEHDRIDISLKFVIIAIVSLYIYLCPYTKVEESFNLQATHDILYYGVFSIDKYDHLEFPGVVPRTFIGPLIISILLSPIIAIQKICIAYDILSILHSKFLLQYLTRFVLGMMNLVALFKLSQSIRKVYGCDTSKWFLVIFLCQFHYLFYISRPLPNCFALVFVVLAISCWLDSEFKKLIGLLSFTTIVFRGDTAVLFAPILFTLLLQRRVSIVFAIQWGLISSLLSILLTILIDSYFWQRWLWPEGEVLWFNTVANRSSEYGTSPFLWYFYSALPRSLLCSIGFIPFGISPMLSSLFRCQSFQSIYSVVTSTSVINTRSMQYFIPTVLYVLLFSILPHKELRFIFNAIPLFNLIASIGAANLSRSWSKTKLPTVLAFFILIVSCITTFIFLQASRVNYPGGEALSYLHNHYRQDRNLPRSIHIDVPAAMTGVSRFGEIYGESWRYSKDENLVDIQQFKTFDFLISAKYPTKWSIEFNLIHEFHVFDHVSFSYDYNMPIQIHTHPYIYLLERKEVV